MPTSIFLIIRNKRSSKRSFKHFSSFLQVSCLLYFSTFHFSYLFNFTNNFQLTTKEEEEIEIILV